MTRMLEPTIRPRRDRARLGAGQRRGGAGAAALAAAMMLSLASVAAADELKLGDFWIRNLTVINIDEGAIHYSDDLGTESSRALDRLNGMKLSVYPALATAQDALDAGEDLKAVRALETVRGRTRDAWLRHWVLHLEVEALDRLGQALPAATRFVTLAREGAEPHYLETPPLQSLAKAPEPQARQIATRVREAIEAVDEGPARDALQSMLDQLTAPPPANGADNGETTTTTTTTDAAAESVVALPQRLLEENDPITRKLKAGDFAGALELVDARLARPEPLMAKRLYQRGMAQLGLAEASGKEEDYKTAGLSFLRCDIHFPRSYTWVGPSLIEAGYVHLMIDRPDVALRVLDKAQTLVDAEEDAELYDRLNMLRAEAADLSSRMR